MLLMKAAKYENYQRGDTDWLWKLADEAFEQVLRNFQENSFIDNIYHLGYCV